MDGWLVEWLVTLRTAGDCWRLEESSTAASSLQLSKAPQTYHHHQKRLMNLTPRCPPGPPPGTPPGLPRGRRGDPPRDLPGSPVGGPWGVPWGDPIGYPLGISPGILQGPWGSPRVSSVGGPPRGPPCRLPGGFSGKSCVCVCVACLSLNNEMDTLGIPTNLSNQFVCLDKMINYFFVISDNF